MDLFPDFTTTAAPTTTAPTKATTLKPTTTRGSLADVTTNVAPPTGSHGSVVNHTDTTIVVMVTTASTSKRMLTASTYFMCIQKLQNYLFLICLCLNRVKMSFNQNKS